jgi:hypothetical protein
MAYSATYSDSTCMYLDYSNWESEPQAAALYGVTESMYARAGCLGTVT